MNAFRLKVFWGDMETADADRLAALLEDRLHRGQYHVIDVDRSRLARRFHELSALTPETGCRTMDILQLACPLQLEPVSFLSFDGRQRALAERVGLTVVPDTTEM